MAILLTAAVVAGISGCSGGAPGPRDAGTTSSASPTATTSSASPTTTAPISPSPTATASSAAPSEPSTSGTPVSACGPAAGEDAAADAIASLALPPGLEDAEWDAAFADYSGYDPCADLSWTVVPLAGATASSPSAILLFHQGSFLGTATAEQYGFTPEVERTAPGAILVEYRYPLENESNADASGTASATFTWNPGTERVDMAGDTPPTG